jgi:hypothetical protein
MIVSGKFKEKLGKVKTHLTSLDDQPLGKAALIIVLFLDIFILIAIFNGLGAHTRQLSSPDEYIPYSCREIVINRHWNPPTGSTTFRKSPFPPATAISG